MASTTSSDVLPKGGKIFTTFPDILFLPEFVIGGLVWILVASTHVYPPNPLGWVMFVSVFCFVGTTLWFFIFACGGNQSSFWPTMDVAFHFVSTVFYLSASVILAYMTYNLGQFTAVNSVEALKSLQAVDFCSGYVPRGHSSLLHPYHFFCHSMEEILKRTQLTEMKKKKKI
ncbi:Myelin and lymphocyte protein [Oryzias melastigma]|uniref:Myelin and lymphocyte protein n=1 Tax=Oryzias melastigma TaxID=30732 RepID=A0A834FHX9_ORYME|nr:Myelin and lymphocyte protein [Oryzias melastigma]